MHADAHVVGNNTDANTFSGALFHFNGGPAILHGGYGGDTTRWVAGSVVGSWYESLQYSTDGRPIIKRVSTGTRTTKPRQQFVARLTALTQPAVMDESAANIRVISELVAEHTSEQKIRTDGELRLVCLCCHCGAVVVPCPLTLRDCANPVASPLSPLGTKFTSQAKNVLKVEEFYDFCAEEGNEGYAAQLEELHIATKAWLKKHVANRSIWTGYASHLLAEHRDKNGKMRTCAAAD